MKIQSSACEIIIKKKSVLSISFFFLNLRSGPVFNPKDNRFFCLLKVQFLSICFSLRFLAARPIAFAAAACTAGTILSCTNCINRLRPPLD